MAGANTAGNCSTDMFPTDQTIRMHLPARFDARFIERAEEPLAIFVILEDGLAPISPIHEVINRARIFH